MELKDTIELMISKDYTERFKAEFYQLKIRIEKLSAMLLDYKEDKLKFKPNCSYALLNEQLQMMKMYLSILMLRASIENIRID